MGYTLDYPASGDWMFTKKNYEIAGERLKNYCPEDIQEAWELSMEYLNENHLVKSEEEEYQQFISFYSDISQNLNLALTNSILCEYNTRMNPREKQLWSERLTKTN